MMSTHKICFWKKKKINKYLPGYYLSVAVMMMMIWCFTSISTLFKTYRDIRSMIMKGSVQ